MSPVKHAKSVQEAIRQTKPFRSKRVEATIALFLTADVVRNRIKDLFAAHGDLTHQQYNVLRILRGAGEGGLPTLDIAERMIEQTPGVTRLIDRLVEKQLVARVRPEGDRRQVLCVITRRGLDLLAKLDGPVDSTDQAIMKDLSDREVDALLTILDKIRTSNSHSS